VLEIKNRRRVYSLLNFIATNLTNILGLITAAIVTRVSYTRYLGSRATENAKPTDAEPPLA
jgi:hypothetical protein